MLGPACWSRWSAGHVSWQPSSSQASEETSLPWRSLLTGPDYPRRCHRSRPRILHPFCTQICDTNTVRPLTDRCSKAYGISYSILIKIDTGPFIQEFSKHFKVKFLSVQSVRNKALDICDYIIQANADLVFLCETWLRPEGDEADCAALTPPGFCLKSLPRQSGTGGVALLFYIEPALQKHCSFNSRFCFYSFWDVWSASFLWLSYCSVYHPPPSRQNKFTNAMFLEQYSDLLESYGV